MPRGQDAPIRRGGEIDPYVAGSALQRKQQAGNRLIAAMQESGQTARTAMQERGATQRTGMQVSAQQAMEAARLAAEDRRGAEAERARREDREFAMARQEGEQLFETKQTQLQREHEDAIMQEQWDRADKIMEQQRVLQSFRDEVEMKNAGLDRNAYLSTVKMMANKESAKEKLATNLIMEEEKEDRNTAMSSEVENGAVQAFADDKRSDYPVVAAVVEEMGKVKKGILQKFSERGPGIATTVATWRGAGKIRELSKEVKKGGPRPLAIVQDQISQTGSTISIEELHPENIKTLEQRLAYNDVQAEDVRNTAAVLRGAFKAVSGKITAAESDTERNFWKETRMKISGMQNSINKLKTSTRLVEGSKTETVGKRVNAGLGITSIGRQIKMLKETGLNNWEAILDTMMKSEDPYQPYVPAEGMTPFARQIREDYNAILGRVSSTVGGL
uniref:Uncharacterized protein n=1 Tax=viral metagenome TaxID=1070528 RepID=A0A6M3KQ47_9ZZZZ